MSAAATVLTPPGNDQMDIWFPPGTCCDLTFAATSCGTLPLRVAAQLRHSCGTLAAQLRHTCGTVAAHLRHTCGTCRGTLSGTVHIKRLAPDASVISGQFNAVQFILMPAIRNVHSSTVSLMFQSCSVTVHFVQISSVQFCFSSVQFCFSSVSVQFLVSQPMKIHQRSHSQMHYGI